MSATSFRDPVPRLPSPLHPPSRPQVVVAVVVTHDRPALLRACLDRLLAQRRAPDVVLVVDNASGAETVALAAAYPGVEWLRLARNTGGAGGFRAGMEGALSRGADWLWLMDDDGRPAADDALGHMLNRAASTGAAMVGAMVVDVDDPARLAFPVRIAGRTVFDAATLMRHGLVHGFAHLFNGALVAAALVTQIGPPDARFVIRGDEVHFLYCARAAGAAIVLDPAVVFLHPGSMPEIFPILFGHFYAVVPADATKRFYLFRNRGYIFRRHGLWAWLLADVVRYGWYYLISRRGDLRGFWRWARATTGGVVGRFMRESQ